MGTRYFTLAEANALVPHLEEAMGLILRLRGSLRVASQELELLGEPLTDETLQREGGPPELVRIRGRARALVETLGDRVEEVELFPSAHGLWDWQRTIMAAEMASNLERLWSGRERLSPQLRELMERGREVRAIDHQRALRALEPVRASFDELFMERYDAILTPPALGTAPRGLGATGDPAFCVPWTLLGMPAITLPVMRGESAV